MRGFVDLRWNHDVTAERVTFPGKEALPLQCRRSLPQRQLRGDGKFLALKAAMVVVVRKPGVRGEPIGELSPLRVEDFDKTCRGSTVRQEGELWSEGGDRIAIAAVTLTLTCRLISTTNQRIMMIKSIRVADVALALTVTAARAQGSGVSGFFHRAGTAIKQGASSMLHGNTSGTQMNASGVAETTGTFTGRSRRPMVSSRSCSTAPDMVSCGRAQR
ncbi:MAG TPA: hypothetical protein VMV33_09440 [Rhodocyclaceae bacterium]|nr:hypothetical protein [Rhodocyclaceae bacterium]